MGSVHLQLEAAKEVLQQLETAHGCRSMEPHEDQL
jgi:hypothetical protein